MAAVANDAASAHLLRCSIPIRFTYSVLSRRLPGQAAPQTLVQCGAEGLRLLLGADVRGPLQLGPPLQLYAEPPAAGGGGGGEAAAAAAAGSSGAAGAAGGAAAAAAARQPYGGDPFLYPIWDVWSASVYMVQGNGILRLTADNTVTLVAGSVAEEGEADGAGGAARFSGCNDVIADGRGRLFVADRDRIRQLQLPAAWETGGAVGLAAAGGAAAAGGEAVVTTLPLRAPSSIQALAFEGGSSDGSGSLLYATRTAVYRLPLGSDGAAAAAAAPVLLAGREGERGSGDGRGSGVRFNAIAAFALDGDGCVYMGDHQVRGKTAVRRMAGDGTVTTIAGAALGEWCYASAILPNGCLALRSDKHLHVLDLGLRLPPGHAGLPPPAPPPPKPSGPPPNSLSADMGSLLQRQPDGTADVTVLVQEQPFHAHKAILGSRSPYFRQRFGGGFAEGSEQQVELHGTQPEVFERVLLYIYTDAVDVPPALAQGVAELADRLLLPELCAAAQAVVEAGVRTSSVVGALLWADAAGTTFSALLGRLKGWYAEHHEEVLEQAPESIKLLTSSPSLLVELMQAGTREAKRARTS